MAIYLLHVKPISRAKGGRVTRSAAYRAGERIRDERTRELYDFTDRDDVVHKEILLCRERPLAVFGHRRPRNPGTLPEFNLRLVSQRRTRQRGHWVPPFHIS